MNDVPLRRVFLSSVTGEFGEHRRMLKDDLSLPRVKVQEQDDLIQSGGKLLQTLNDYIRDDCDAVIHLVGCETGHPLKPDEVRWLLETYDDFPDRFPFLQADLNRHVANDPRLSYTQMEAWLALYHHKRCHLYRPFDLLTNQLAGEHPQLIHWQRLESLGEHHGTFDDPQHLCRRVLRDLHNLWPQDIPNASNPVWLPYPTIGDLFTGRTDFLTRLRGRFTADNGTTAPVRCKALHGLGGVGKTRLAVEYAWAYAGAYSAVLFVSANSPDEMGRALAESIGPMGLNLEEHAAPEQDVRVAAALRWLREHPGWLLVLDMIETGEAAEDVDQRFLRCFGGHVLSTSRLDRWSEAIESIEVDVLALDDAAQFLLQRTNPKHGGRGRKSQSTDTADAAELAAALDGLALALEQAGAFIAQWRITLAEYLRRWRSKLPEVQSWHDPRTMKYPRSLAVTWQTTVEQLSFEAQCLLNMLSFFAPDPIPGDVFAGAPPATLLYAVTHIRSDGRHRNVWRKVLAFVRYIFRPPTPVKHTGRLEDFDFSKYGKADVNAALEELASFSILRQTDGTNPGVVIHRVVQAVIKQRLSEVDRGEFAEFALVLLGYVVAMSPIADVAHWQTWEQISPHVRSMLNEAEYGDGSEALALGFMAGLGAYCLHKALYDEAELWLRKVVDRAEERPGVVLDSNAYIGSLTNLATIAGHKFAASESERLFIKALELLREQEHPNLAQIALVECNLGRLAFETGDRPRARTLTLSSLEVLRNVPGQDYPTALNNLGLIEYEEEDLEAAEKCFREALQVETDLLGSRHPAIARTRSNLGRVLRDKGQFSEAENNFRLAIDIYREFHGPDYPELGITQSNLGQLAQMADRYDEAEQCFIDALRIHRASHAAGHPRIAIELVNLGNLYILQSRFEEAVQRIEEAIAIDQEAYGPDHWEIATDWFNLAMAKMGLHDFDEAKDLLERALAIKIRERGASHSSVSEVKLLLARIAELQVCGTDSIPLPNLRQLRTSQHVGRNDPCPCKSGKKYKHCCGRKR